MKYAAATFAALALAAAAATPFGQIDEGTRMLDAAETAAAIFAAATASTNYTDRAATAATNYTRAFGQTLLATGLSAIAEATTNLTARPWHIAYGQTDIDAHGDAHNGPVQIGEGAAATVDTSEVPTNVPIRSVSVAIGAGADARDLDHPDKQQSIAIGNQARASGVNSLAIGSGVRHVDEDDMTGGNAYAEGAQAIALGYAAKSVTNNAVQIGTGVNSEPHTLQFEDTVIVRGGKVVTDGLDTNAVRRMIQDESEKGIMYGSTGSTNGYAYIKMSGYNGAQDTDPEFVLAVNTNENSDVAASFPIYPGSPNRREVYSAATVDRLLGWCIKTNAYGYIGRGPIVIGTSTSSASGRNSVAIGYAMASGDYSFAQGDYTSASGDYSSAMGYGISAGGWGCHAEGYNTKTRDGRYYGAHAEGCNTAASNTASHAEGQSTRAYGAVSHAAGYYAVVTNDYAWVWNGDPDRLGNLFAERYNSHGTGTYNINPIGGAEGFYIGDSNLVDIVNALIDARLQP